MRVISGSARGSKLLTNDGLHTRPTADRVKEALFNMVSGIIPGSRVFDMFAGTGAIGIEALSRGAEIAVFSDNDKKSVEIIRSNIEKTKFTGKSKILFGDIFSFKKDLSEFKFDFIYIDPPYFHNITEQSVKFIIESGILARGGIIAVEKSSGVEFSIPPNIGLTIFREKRYGTTALVFIKEIDK